MSTSKTLRNEQHANQPAQLTVRRVAGRAPVLPSARAAVGALLCVAAALLTFVAYAKADRPPSTSYLVATHDLLPNVAIQSSDFRRVNIALPSEQSALAMSSAVDLTDAHLKSTMRKGELFLASNVDQSSPTATQEMSFVVDHAYAAGGRVQAGEHIQVLASGNSDGPGTIEIAHDVRVLSISRTDLTTNSGPLIITIAADGSFDVNRFAEAIHGAKLTVVRGAPIGASTPSVQAAVRDPIKNVPNPKNNVPDLKNKTKSVVPTTTFTTADPS